MGGATKIRYIRFAADDISGYVHTYIADANIGLLRSFLCHKWQGYVTEQNIRNQHFASAAAVCIISISILLRCKTLSEYAKKASLLIAAKPPSICLVCQPQK
jgi:hypothetical protein